MAQIVDAIGTIKQKISNTFVLPYFAINDRLEMQCAGVPNHIRSNETRPQRGEGVKPFAEAPLRDPARKLRIPLQLSGRYIIAACVRGHVVEGVGEGHVFGVAADDQTEFTLVVGLVVLADLWDVYRIIVTGDASRGLEKDEREWRRCPLCLSDMFGIVEANTS